MSTFEFQATPADCPVCGAPPDQQRALFVKQQAHFVRCRGCGFEFINPRPTEAMLKERYDQYGDAYFTNASKLASDFAPGRFRTELALVGSPTGRLLDVGCATGAFVAEARRAGHDARGIDSSEPSTRYGREELTLPLEVGDLYEQGYADASFDIITFWATLEHLPDPARFLSEAHRLLVDGGRLAVSVPNHAGLSQRILGRRHRYVGIDHVNYFTGATLVRLLGRHGFTTTTRATDRFNPIVMWQDLRGLTPDGATVEQQLADQRVTDRIKHGGGLPALARGTHRAVTAALRTVGLGDLLYVVALLRS